MIHVKFFKLDKENDWGGPGEPEEIDVDTNALDEAFSAACKKGADPFRKMFYRVIDM